MYTRTNICCFHLWCMVCVRATTYTLLLYNVFVVIGSLSPPVPLEFHAPVTGA